MGDSGANADERLSELLALEEGWNGYRSPPVDRAVAERVRTSFSVVEGFGLSPWICPLSDGSLQIERAGTDDYCVEFNRDGTASVHLEGLSDTDALWFLMHFALVRSLDCLASAGEAGTATTVQQGVVHEHAAPKGDAQHQDIPS